LGVAKVEYRFEVEPASWMGMRQCMRGGWGFGSAKSIINAAANGGVLNASSSQLAIDGTGNSSHSVLYVHFS
jgi:hypothetical protein